VKLDLDHTVVTITDWERSNAFYRDVLGAEIVPRGPVYAYRFGNVQLNVHGPGFDAYPVPDEPTPAGGGDMCFAWPGSPESAIDHLRSHGVEVVEGPVERQGAQGMGTSVYFHDPDGTLLELISYGSG
jgi:catechol 2,3-dioxygenase-like lactoylglutathione lyase family enzyme